MKLPQELLRPLVEPPYVREPGDIDISSLLQRQSEPAGENADMNCTAEIFDETFNLTAAGIRTLNVLKSMRDENRKKILSFTSKEAQNVSDIAGHLGSTQPATSHHLNILFSQGLLRRERNGKNNLYSVSGECRSAVQSLCISLEQLNRESDTNPLEETQHADAFSALIDQLSDGMRLRIMKILQSQDETSVDEMCKILKVSQPGVSHHLALMREARVIEFRKDGKHNYYSISEHGKAMLKNAAEMLKKTIGMNHS